MIQHTTIDGLLLRDMVMAGTALLEKHRDEVDALNVFPVPDGDTGTNMSLTMRSACTAINSQEYLRADQAASALSKGALRGARGNSGVITSQLFRGFAKALDGVEKITPVQFANALKKGSDLAYKAVMKPKEGTILTVARVVAEEALKQVQAEPDNYDALINVMLRSGEAILKKTTDMLPALKQANVVDSGGRGLLWIYAGYAAAMRGEDISAMEEESASEEEDGGEVRYTYAVEFTLRGMGEVITDGDIDSFRRRLNRIGDHVKVSGDSTEVKASCHTDNPGKAIEDGLELGELFDITIENQLGEQHMAELAEAARQAEEKAAAEKAAAEAEAAAKAEEERRKAEPSKTYGMVAVSLGAGFSDIFRDLTVDVIVEGGQTMNPSIDDILQAINQVDAKCVFVFPNNGNVILAAQQAAELAEKEVRVIPTKNVAMGIAAAVAFQPEADIDTNAAAMEEASQHVRTATVTYAVRDSEYNDVEIHQGDIIGLYNGQITCSGSSVHDVVTEMMKTIVTEDDELLTVYYGADTSTEDAETLTAELAETYDFCDVECHAGGQPLYYYLISVE